MQTYSGVGAFIILMGAAVAFNHSWTGDGVAEDRPNINLMSPGPEVLSAVTFEHALMASDLFWLGVVQEFGFQGDKPVDYPKTFAWTQIATDLDPHYYIAYYATAINLSSYAKDVERSDTILKKGRKNLPGAWQFPMLMGYNAYFVRGDALAASELWFATSLMKGAPAFVASLAARARNHTGDAEGAIELLLTLMPSLEGAAREDAEIRLKLFRSEPILAAYDKACEAYRAQAGVIPSPDELYQGGAVTYPPFDLVESPIEFDENCRARTKVIFVREDEAKERVGMERPDKK